MSRLTEARETDGAIITVSGLILKTLRTSGFTPNLPMREIIGERDR